MPRLTITITDRQADLLEKKTGEGGEYESKSEVVRTFIQEYERLSERVDELERERDRLERKLTKTNSRNDDVDELVEYVQEERDLRQRREERRDAPLWTRAKWYIFGRGRSNEKSDT